MVLITVHLNITMRICQDWGTNAVASEQILPQNSGYGPLLLCRDWERSNRVF